jgi:hypothetical protein
VGRLRIRREGKEVSCHLSIFREGGKRMNQIIGIHLKVFNVAMRRIIRIDLRIRTKAEEESESQRVRFGKQKRKNDRNISNFCRSISPAINNLQILDMAIPFPPTPLGKGQGREE